MLQLEPRKQIEVGATSKDTDPEGKLDTVDDDT